MAAQGLDHLSLQNRVLDLKLSDPLIVSDICDPVVSCKHFPSVLLVSVNTVRLSVQLWDRQSTCPECIPSQFLPPHFHCIQVHLKE